MLQRLRLLQSLPLQQCEYSRCRVEQLLAEQQDLLAELLLHQVCDSYL